MFKNLGISYDNKVNRITYEEVIDDTRPIQTKNILGVEVEQEHIDNDKYTFEMAELTDKVKEVITKIKLKSNILTDRILSKVHHKLL